MRSKQRAFLCFKSVFITRPGLQQWSKYSLVIDSNDYWSLIQNFTGEWRKFKEENRTRYQEMVTPWGTSETEHGLDSGPLTLTVKYSVPCLFHKEKKKKKDKTLYLLSSTSCRNANGGCLLQGLVKTRPNQFAPRWTAVLNFHRLLPS